MAPRRKPDWIRPTTAGKILGVNRGTVLYRAALGRYAVKVDENTGVTLVSRRDVEKDAKAKAA